MVTILAFAKGHPFGNVKQNKALDAFWSPESDNFELENLPSLLRDIKQNIRDELIALYTIEDTIKSANPMAKRRFRPVHLIG